MTEVVLVLGEEDKSFLVETGKRLRKLLTADIMVRNRAVSDEFLVTV